MKNSFKDLRIMFAGPSGTGKTTLANFVSSNIGTVDNPLKFISGSVSDLLPDTASIPHKEMLARDSKVLALEDFQILNLRQKLFRKTIKESGNFVSDRSFLDSAAYFLYKQADKLPQCEVEHFLNMCLMCLTQTCSHLILVPFNMQMYNGWITEDNGKRITSRYFQMEISTIMSMILEIWGFRKRGKINAIGKGFFISRAYDYGVTYGDLITPYGSTRVFILNEVNRENRQGLLTYILNKR